MNRFQYASKNEMQYDFTNPNGEEDYNAEASKKLLESNFQHTTQPRRTIRDSK